MDAPTGSGDIEDAIVTLPLRRIAVVGVFDREWQGRGFARAPKEPQ